MKSPFTLSALALAMLAPLAARADISVAVNIRPPELPVYVQPPVPGDGYLWTPGYWGWNVNDNDYYWIPGTWVLAPTPGYLWTPGYWGYGGGGYRWNVGYWGPRVGFYGGIAYGFGYTGSGYYGGRWDRGVFHYNRAVNNVNTTVVRNVYNTTVVNNYNVKRVSFNGPGGIEAQPSKVEREERNTKHIEPTPNQVQHERTAMATPEQKASVNHGTPKIAATEKPSELAGADNNKARERGDAATNRPSAGNNEQRNSRTEGQARAPARNGAEADAAVRPNAGPEQKAARAGEQPMDAEQQRAAKRERREQREQQQHGQREPAAEKQVQEQPKGAPRAQPQARGDGNSNEPRAQAAEQKAAPRVQPQARDDGNNNANNNEPRAQAPEQRAKDQRRE